VREHLVRLRLCGFANLLGQGLIVGENRDVTAIAFDGLVHAQHGQLRVTHRRFLYGPFEGPLGMTRTVYADNYSRHLSSLFRLNRD
jgi:hypothetical protein